MSTMVSDLFVRLSAMTGPYTASMVEASEQGEAFAETNKATMESVEATNSEGAASFGLIGKAAAGLAVGFVAASAVSLKWATSFQSATTLLYTQAGLTTAQLAAAGYTSATLQGKMLSLGNQYGFTGTQMAEALYHPISAGLDLASALNVVQDSAQEARISGADLTDTTYTLSTVMKAFNQPASQAAQTMATLNAVVGNGDTTFQDLNDSVKTWAPTANSFGVSLTSIGAALDYMTDRGDSMTTAGTHVAMMMAMMVGQTKQASGLMVTLGLDTTQVTAANSAMATALQKSGITQTRLASDLQQPDGLYVALNDLQTSMVKAGVKGTEASDLLVKAFGGGKSFKSVAELMANLGGLQQKFTQLNTQGTVQQWDADWTAAAATMKVQLDKIGAAVQNAGIAFGMYLLPKAQQFLTYLTTNGSKVASSLGKDFTQLSQGFSGNLPGAPTPMHAAGLNRIQQTIAPPPLTDWQKFGQIVHTLETDLVTFGQDAARAFATLVKAAQPAAAVFGGAFMVALVTLGSVLKNQVGPALLSFAQFLEKHGPEVKFFAEVILVGLITKLTILSTIKAATGILGLATSIVQFPLKQAGAIGTAVKGLQTAWSGNVSAGGGVAGLTGSLAKLRDKVLDTGTKIKGMFSDVDTVAGSGTMKLREAQGAWEEVGDEAENSSGVIAGLFGKVSDAFSKIMPTKLDVRIFMQSVKDAGRQVGQAVAGWAGTIAGGAKTAFQAVGSAASSVATTAAGWGRSIGASIGSGLASAAGVLKSGAQTALSAVGTAASAVASTAASWGQSIATSISSGVSTAADGLSTLATNAGTAAASLASSAWSGITGTLSSVGTAISGAAVATWRLVTAGTAAAIAAARQAIAWTAAKIAMLGSAIAEGVMTAATWLLDVALDANPISILIIAITALVAVFVVLWLKCAGFRDFWKGLWNDISGAASTAWNWLYGNVLQPVGHFFDTVIMGALNGAKTLWDQVWGGFKTTVATIWGYLQPVFNTITSAISTIAGALGGLSGQAGKAAGSISGAANLLASHGYEDGGFVPGSKGQPQLAIVHGGEYVISNAMLSGSAPIDNRVMTGSLAAGDGGGGGGGGSAGALAVQPGGGAGAVTVTNINVMVQTGPQLSTDAAVQQAVQQAMNRLGMRASSSYAPYQASRARSS